MTSGAQTRCRRRLGRVHGGGVQGRIGDDLASRDVVHGFVAGLGEKGVDLADTSWTPPAWSPASW
ncbi:hypothetical protein LV779_26135 [Streptomyces thinghirensis]|nr:hypothetical protein [Streptomyces thinghirensis]